MITSIEIVREIVREAGAIAQERQKRFDFSRRTLKEDGSVLTEIDQEMDEWLYRHLHREFPRANILTEETVRNDNPQNEFTFAVDPIDGTDVFSQGMPGWAISVGLLDARLQPIAGVVYAPRWNSLFFRDVRGTPQHNGREIVANSSPPITHNTTLMVYSHIHRDMDLRRYPGKIRNIGSTALHICFPLIYPGVCGAVLRKVHLWDLVGAHAIVQPMGMRLEYFQGGAPDYSDFLRGEPAPDFLLVAQPDVLGFLRQHIRVYASGESFHETM